MNALRSLVKYQQVSRTFTTSAVRRRDFAEFKRLQQEMQVDDGVPVFLKKGPRDKIIFGTVLLYSFVVLAISAKTLKRIIFPPPPS